MLRISQRLRALEAKYRAIEEGIDFIHHIRFIDGNGIFCGSLVLSKDGQQWLDSNGSPYDREVHRRYPTGLNHRC
jgi:hypothetical protein